MYSIPQQKKTRSNWLEQACFEEDGVCVVKMNVLAESAVKGGAFLAGRESWVGSVQDDEALRGLGRGE